MASLRIDGLRIDGRALEGDGAELVRRSPVDNDLAWQGRQASPEQVIAAVEAASSAAVSWRQQPLDTRRRLVEAYGEQLRAGADQLASVIGRETGKPAWECRGEVASSIAKVDLTLKAFDQRRSDVDSEAGPHRAQIRYRPLGVAVVLGPFNFPSHLPGGQMIPAVLCGNTVVFKPSELTPGVGQWLVDAWHRAGASAGVVNLVQGGRQVAETAIDHDQIAAVMFTGSHRTGQAIHRRLAGRPDVLLSLEMGGNNPLVVRDSADPERTAAAIVASAFITAGQRCTCARRLMVMDDDEGAAVIDALARRVDRLRVGLPGDDPEPFLGPLITSHAAEALLAAQQSMRDAGGQVIVGMRRSDRCPALVTPGIIDMTGATGSFDAEWFGPLLQVLRAPDFETAIQWAGQTRFGLAAALFGGDARDFEQFRQQVPAGVVNWNRQTTGASGALPFGGLGDSGNHRPMGFWAVDACSDPVASLIAEDAWDESFDRMQL